MSGLFSTFNIARRGMSVSQKQIDVTTHNISNANTAGFSRQRAEAVTTKPFGMPSINNVAEPGQLGTGVEIASIERIRDSFLDFQVRNETSTMGKYQTRANYLNEIENILNEPSDTGLSTVIGNFYKSWDELSKQASGSNSRTVVVQQTLALTDALNQTSTQLQKLRENAQDGLKSDVFQVNNMLNQINQLNKEIRAVKVAGNSPNDLMDKRDLLLDQLSSKFNINIDKKQFEGTDLKSADESGMGGNNYFVKSIDNESYSRLSVIDNIQKNADGSITVNYYKLGNSQSSANMSSFKINGPLTDADIKKLDETRVLWSDENGQAVTLDGSGKRIAIPDNGTISLSDVKMFEPASGELQGLISIQKDVNGYIDQLDKLAKSIAFSVNAVYCGETDETSPNQTPFFVNKSDPNGVDYGNTEKNITASNITINKKFLDDVMNLKVGKDSNSGEGDGSRALAISQLKDALIKIDDIGVNINSRKDLFDATKGGNTLTNGINFTNNVTGTKTSSYFKDTVDRLGVQAQEANRVVTNQENLLASFEESRNSVSGVSIDEETANLIQYQHAYQANAKIISTLDQLLDVVVNGLKR